MKPFKKKWRKRSLDHKTKILFDYYTFDFSQIEKIRRITDPQKRLIEAAILQFESLGNIHADITAWIAGYRSDSSVDVILAVC